MLAHPAAAVAVLGAELAACAVLTGLIVRALRPLCVPAERHAEGRMKALARCSLIAAPAAVAVWSGWVGLGALCGFGLVQPFPGIVSWHLDTAITLPVGVEAYGAYALGAWLTPGTPERARTFARRSALGALALGMLGQVDLPPAERRARRPGAVAGRGARVLPAGGDARLRRGADSPAAQPRR